MNSEMHLAEKQTERARLAKLPHPGQTNHLGQSRQML
jgi:hypothetical protein